MKRFFFAAMLAFSSMLPACAATADRDPRAEGEEEEQIATETAVVGIGGLSPACFWHKDTQFALRTLGNQSLVGEDGFLRAAPMLSTSCKEVLSYLVRCALPAGETVETMSGETYTGSFGLAARWHEAGMANPEKGWVTACMLQHLNGTESGVPFMLEGPNTELDGARIMEKDVSADSIVGGNLFNAWTAPIDGPPFNAYACVDDGLSEVCGQDAEGALRARMCGDVAASACGLVIVGECSTACTFDESGAVIGCSGDIPAEFAQLKAEAPAISTMYAGACN
jgi:hypothetical protein